MNNQEIEAMFDDCMAAARPTATAGDQIRPLHEEATALGQRYIAATAVQTGGLSTAVNKIAGHSADESTVSREREAALWTAAHRTLPMVEAAMDQSAELAASLMAQHTEELTTLKRKLTKVIDTAKERIKAIDEPLLRQLYQQTGGGSIGGGEAEPGHRNFSVSAKIVANPVVTDQTELPNDWLTPHMPTIKKAVGTSGAKIRQTKGLTDEPEIRLRISPKSGDRQE